MYLILSAFCVGAMLVHFSVPIFNALIFFTFLFVALCVTRHACHTHSDLTNRRLIVLSLGSAIACCVAYTYAQYEVAQHSAQRVSVNETGNEVLLQGYLCGLPRYSHYGFSIPYCSDTGKFHVSASYDFSNLLNTQCSSVQVTLKSPKFSYNPWVGSYERHWFYERVVGFAKVNRVVERDCHSTEWKSGRLTQLRLRIYEHLAQLLDGYEHKGLVIALVLGHRADISIDENQALQDSGTQHLMAISGLHVGLVCFGLLAIMLRLNLARFALPVVAIMGLFYIALVGLSPSAQRAYVMVLIGVLVILGRIPANTFQAWMLALFVVLALDPLSPLSVGFWFSFGAVAALLFIYSFILRLVTLPSLLQLCVVQIILFLFVWLAQMNFGLSNSLFSLAGNLIAIPWVSLVVLPSVLILSLLSVFFYDLANHGFFIVDVILDFLLAFLASGEQLSQSSGLKLQHPIMQCLFILLLIMSVVLIGVSKWLGGSLLLFLYLFLFSENGPEKSKLLERYRLSVLDVGQGLSIVMQSPSLTIVYDTGPSYERYSSARHVLRPYFIKYGLNELDLLVISHGDADHAGDSDWVVKALRPREIVSGEPDRLKTKTNTESCLVGQTWGASNISVEVLWPLDVSGLSKNSNARSCVLKVTFYDTSFLLMGDIEGEEEFDFVRHYYENNKIDLLDTDVLIAGHHGAFKASNHAFLKHVQPGYVVFSAGYANRFNHPHASVLERINSHAANPLITYESGAIFFDVTDRGLSVTRTRSDANNYWLLP